MYVVPFAAGQVRIVLLGVAEPDVVEEDIIESTVVELLPEKLAELLAELLTELLVGTTYSTVPGLEPLPEARTVEYALFPDVIVVVTVAAEGM